MRLLLDIGNTHTRAALTSRDYLTKFKVFETDEWFGGKSDNIVSRLIRKKSIDNIFCSSVVPAATTEATKAKELKGKHFHLLSHRNSGMQINYPKPKTIGPDRLANAIGALDEFRPPLVIVDFGTALTFDIVDKEGTYVGGIICPGLAAMTDYLHEKTALLPKIKLRDTGQLIGKSTAQAMQIGAVHGYRGLIRTIVKELMETLGTRKLNVIATGGYAKMIATKIPETTAIRPRLTLDGLRLASYRTS